MEYVNLPIDDHTVADLRLTLAHEMATRIKLEISLADAKRRIVDLESDNLTAFNSSKKAARLIRTLRKKCN